MSQPAPARMLGLTKRFGATTALDSVKFDVPQGSVFAILGPNGAGKSTVLRLLLNLERPTTGIAEVLGCDSRRLGSAHLREIGYVSEAQRVPEFMRVREFLAYCREFYPSWNDDDAVELLRAFRLNLDHRLKSLSKGARAKVALTSALAYRPKLLLLDEPFASLDVLVREEVARSLLDRIPDTTVVLVTHDLSDIESFASHVAYLDHGRLLFAEEIESLIERFRRIEITFDEPVAAIELGSRGLEAEWGGSVARFVDAEFSRDPDLSALRQRLPRIRYISVEPMSLRSIFVALAGAQERAEE